uniref:Uncharacterized protein n=1 Tax=Anopheles culicifacies TaxID=139723 RepID=A0A182MJC4_9DIPT
MARAIRETHRAQIDKNPEHEDEYVYPSNENLHSKLKPESIERIDIESCEVRLGFLNMLSESRAICPRWLNTTTVSDVADWPLVALGDGETTIPLLPLIMSPALVPLPMLIPLLLLVVLPPSKLFGPL